MSAKTLFANVTGFIRHYAGELAGIVTAIKTITVALPIDNHDKENINNILSDLTDSINSIHSALENMPEVPDVVIRKSDLIEAVKEYLNTPEGKALLGNGGSHA